MISKSITQLANLSPQEKLQLARELVEQVVGDQEAAVLREETKSMLNRSLEEFRANPDQGVLWEDLRDRLKARGN